MSARTPGRWVVCLLLALNTWSHGRLCLTPAASECAGQGQSCSGRPLHPADTDGGQKSSARWVRCGWDVCFRTEVQPGHWGDAPSQPLVALEAAPPPGRPAHGGRALTEISPGPYPDLGQAPRSGRVFATRTTLGRPGRDPAALSSVGWVTLSKANPRLALVSRAFRVPRRLSSDLSRVWVSLERRLLARAWVGAQERRCVQAWRCVGYTMAGGSRGEASLC